MPNDAYQQAAARLLLAHGFLPEKGNDTWINTGKTQWAVAGIHDEEPSKLHLIVYRFEDYDMEHEMFLDLNATDDDSMERVLKPFDLT